MGDAFFGPLFDNGAYLGFQLPDTKLETMLSNNEKFDKYYTKMKVKAGIFDCNKIAVKATDVLTYFTEHYNKEIKIFKKLLTQFPFEEYEVFVDEFPLSSETRKEFLKELIKHRHNKLLSFIRERI